MAMTKREMQSIITAVLTALEGTSPKSQSTRNIQPKAAQRPVSRAESTANLDAKQSRALEMDVRVVRAFKKAGYGDVTPRVDVRTYNRWLADGLKVRVGEKSVKCGTLRLFHRSQCEAYVPPKAENVEVPSQAEKPAAYDKNGRPVYVTKVPAGVSGVGAKVELPEPPLG
jgi:hypothetical protein